MHRKIPTNSNIGNITPARIPIFRLSLKAPDTIPTTVGPPEQPASPARGFLLILRRACLHYRAYQYLQQAAAYRIDGDSDQKSHKSIAAHIRQNCQKNKSHRRTDMRNGHRRTTGSALCSCRFHIHSSNKQSPDSLRAVLLPRPPHTALP